MTRRIDISSRTVVFITVFLLGLWITYQILDLILLLFVALIFMSALSPIVSFLQKLKFPKALGIVIVYLLIIGLLGAALTISFSPLIEQTSRLIQVLPNSIGNLLQIGNVDQSIFEKEIGNITSNLFSYTRSILNNVLTIVLLLVLTFYLLLEKENLEKRAASLFVGQEERIRKLLVNIEEKLGSWLRGQLLLSLIIGVLTFIGLTLLQIPYALPLAIWAGLLEVVPVIGPIIAAIPAILLSLTIAPVLAAGTAAMYFVIQQLENHIIVPQVMGKAVGLNPLVVILAIAVGGRLLGVGGALLAVPLVVVGQIIVTDILIARKE